MSTAMITSLTWVPRGAARARPVRFEISEEEFTRIQHLAALEAQGAKDQAERDRGLHDDSDEESEDDEETAALNAALPPELRMDEYDDDEEKPSKGSKGKANGRGHGGAFGREPAAEGVEEDELAVMESHGGVALAMDADSEDEDADDDQILPGDSLLVVAMTEDEHSHLEVQLLNEEGNMYVHHDIALPEFPLCLSWLDCPPYRDGEQLEGAFTSATAVSEADVAGQRTLGNYIAVGTFQPGIEIWNLDVLDPIEPTAVLGGEMVDEELEAYVRAQRKKGGAKKGKKVNGVDARVFREGSHTEAVMCLSWNREYRQALASGSADNTVKIWDVTTRTCSYTFTHHTDKVQCVQWHPVEAWLLASGSYDGTIALIDCRTATVSATYCTTADIESMQWDPHCPFHLYCSMENGDVMIIDVRQSDSPLCVFHAHDKTCTSLSFSATVPGYFVTASIDKTVRVWDCVHLHTHIPGQGQPVTQKAATKSSKSSKKAGGGGGGGAAAAVASAGGAPPTLIAQKSMNAGKLFSVQCFQDSPFVMAAGGDKGAVAVWLSDELSSIRTHFENRIIDGTPDILRAQADSSSMSELELNERLKAFYNERSDQESDSEDDMSQTSEPDIENTGLSDDDELQEAVGDDTWMDGAASAPAPTAAGKNGKGKGKGKGKAKGKGKK